MSAIPVVPRPETCRQLYIVALPVDIGHHDDIGFPPAGLLRLRGASAEQVHTALEMPHRVVVIERSPVEGAARSALDTRRAAVSLAREYDGVAIDMFVPQIVTADLAAIALEQSAQWFAFGYEDDLTVTYGLDRFGLPEIRCASTAPRSMIDAVLVGLTHRLIGTWPDEEPTGEFDVSLADVARGYGQAAEHDEQRSTRVAVSYAPADTPDDAALEVTLIDDPAETLFRLSSVE